MKDNQNLDEEEVREALGVERLYEVDVKIPIEGRVALYPLTISAVNAKDACNKVITLVRDGSVDAEGHAIEINEEEYDVLDNDGTGWEFNVVPKEKEEQNE